MRALTAEEVLSAAERLRGEPPPRRGAALLALAGMRRETALTLPVGERDDRLLAMRIATFGRELTGVADCPSCGEACEIAIDGEAIRLASESGDFGRRSPDEIEVELVGWRVRARLPNSEDVAEAVGSSDARRALLERCIVEQSRDGEIPDAIADAIEAEMERVDPRGDISLALACPRCATSWSASFDVSRFFWMELNAAAKRLVQEVDILARAYGWSERDILNMSAPRRQTYVEKCIE